MKKGTLNVDTQDIFPIIKKFLYTDQEIFLRELISNATDATRKLQVLASKGEFDEELGDVSIEVKLDEKKKRIHIIDKGIGMIDEEVEKYINQIAFSSAKEFVKLYQDKEDKNKIIGHFGLGFYSSFMVAEKVEIITKSYKKDTKAVKWECSGSTEFSLSEDNKEERGTEVILHISKDAKEYANELKIKELLDKYCKFMPVEIFFGTEKVQEPTGEKDEEGNEKTKEVEKPRLINNPEPLWTKQPSDLKDEDYKKFYEELYPFSQPPLFWIHLNVDYPFNLTGVLYFPKIQTNVELQKNKIKLFSNQVYVTDTVDDIVPEFLTLLHGVIDSPDIPLNVSRSSLQADSNVKKISNYIIRKVADKLNGLFKSDREDFEKKWDDIDTFVKYGMLTEEKFYEKAEKFSLLKDVENKYYTLEEYKDKTKDLQTDKDGNRIWLYSTNLDEQDGYIELAEKRGYNVLYLDDVLDSHLINRLEQKNEKTQIKRIDAAPVNELINKDEKSESVLNKDALEQLEKTYKEVLGDDKANVKTEALSPDDPPLLITEDEFMRRFSEMSKVGGSPMMGMGDMPPMYNYIVNSNHKLAKKITDADEKRQKEIARQVYDLARLSKNILKGKDLTDFINRSIEIV